MHLDLFAVLLVPGLYPKIRPFSSRIRFYRSTSFRPSFALVLWALVLPSGFFFAEVLFVFFLISSSLVLWLSSSDSDVDVLFSLWECLLFLELLFFFCLGSGVDVLGIFSGPSSVC